MIEPPSPNVIFLLQHFSLKVAPRHLLSGLLQILVKIHHIVPKGNNFVLQCMEIGFQMRLIHLQLIPLKLHLRKNPMGLIGKGSKGVNLILQISLMINDLTRKWIDPLGYKDN